MAFGTVSRCINFMLHGKKVLDDFELTVCSHLDAVYIIDIKSISISIQYSMCIFISFGGPFLAAFWWGV